MRILKLYLLVGRRYYYVRISFSMHAAHSLNKNKLFILKYDFILSLSMPLVSNVCFLHCAKETYTGIYYYSLCIREIYTIIPERMKMKPHRDVCRYATNFIEKLKRVWTSVYYVVHSSLFYLITEWKLNLESYSKVFNS